MWYVGQRPATVDDGGEEPDDRKDFVPPPGGISWRLFTLKPSGGKAIGPLDDPRFDQDRVGFHATPTIDFIEIISGQIRLELNEHWVELAAGDCVIQRGTWHRWIVIGDEPCTFSATMLGVGDGDDPGFAGASVGTVGPRRIVTDGDGVCADGPPATASQSDGGLLTAELWHTFAPVVSELQGGDAPQSEMQLNPPGGGSDLEAGDHSSVDGRPGRVDAPNAHHRLRADRPGHGGPGVAWPAADASGGGRLCDSAGHRARLAEYWRRPVHPVGGDDRGCR